MPVRDDEWLGTNGFTWFMGIVEDRNDPLRVGRVRVRCFGWHTADKTQQPTDTLPWAVVMMPANSAASSGVGSSPTGLVEGSWVVGFFMDGAKAQQPMIMGTWVGVAGDAGDDTQGFGDPNGTYPVAQNTPDTSALAVGGTAYLNHSSTQDRMANRVTGVPTATPPKTDSVSLVEEEEFYEPKTWDQPQIQGLTLPPLYPFNHVRTTEAGHVFEIDDTEGARRIHEYHASGSFREIRNDGTRETRIVGDDYEIIVRDKNVLISGACNVTVKGDAKLMVEGTMTQEVSGDYYLAVRGSMYVKVDGNEAVEVVGTSTRQINGAESKRVSQDSTVTIGGDTVTSYAGTHTQTNLGNMSLTLQGDQSIAISGKSIVAVAGDMLVGSGAKMEVAGKSSFKAGSPGPTTIKGSRVDLNP